MTFDPKLLRRHVAVVGMTGSGKTSTAKLMVEQVVAEKSRVCIIDPCKSDWWGLIASADGKRDGLPFYILGGPRGHVGLPAAGGAAIGRLVALGELPLSILDMADLEPGEPQRFFVDFARALFRSMAGVLYLVVEEAHLFAPKEKAGHGHENMATHWLKQLAAAGRSKGIRLVVCTQRVQALHNAVLGSCETLIGHRLTAPADQKPIIDWIAANTSAAESRSVAESIARLETGEAFVCASGGVQRNQFGRIKTYDNSATPEDDHGQARSVRTAAVDLGRLETLLCEAAKEAVANDPKTLRAEVARLRGELERAKQTAAEVQVVERPALGAADMERLEAIVGDLRAVADAVRASVKDSVVPAIVAADRAVDSAHALLVTGRRTHAAPPASGRLKLASEPEGGSNGDHALPKMQRRMLTALAQYPAGLQKGQVLLHADYASSGPTSQAFAQLDREGWTASEGGRLRITPAGLTALGPFEQLPRGVALRKLRIERAATPMEAVILRTLFDAYPGAMSKGEIIQRSGYKSSGPLSACFAKLTRLGWMVKRDGGFAAAAEFFT